jgi:hypothetical protein
MPRFVTLMMGLSKLAFRQSRKTGGRKSVTLGCYSERKRIFVKSFSVLIFCYQIAIKYQCFPKTGFSKSPRKRISWKPVELRQVGRPHPETSGQNQRSIPELPK